MWLRRQYKHAWLTFLLFVGFFFRSVESSSVWFGVWLCGVLVAVEFMLGAALVAVAVDVEAAADDEDVAVAIGPEFEGFGLGAMGGGNTAISKCTCREKPLRSRVLGPFSDTSIMSQRVMTTTAESVE